MDIKSPHYTQYGVVGYANGNNGNVIEFATDSDYYEYVEDETE